MTSLGGFPTYDAERRLEAARAAGVVPVPLHGTPSPALPAHVVAAVADALSRPMAAPSPHGLSALREASADELERTTGRRPDPVTEVLVTNGAMHALALTMRTLVGPGDEVVVPAPTFFFEGPIRSAGAEPVYVLGSEDDGWRWDAAAIERAVGPRTRALLLCNPGNPTGSVASRAEVEEALAVAATHGLVTITDEAYEAALWGGPEGAGLISAFGLAEDVIVIRSLGKSLSLPQLRCGIVSGPAHHVAACARALEWDCLRVGLAPQVAALAVLQGPRDWLEDVHAGLLADRTAALAAVSRTDGLTARAPAATPFLFVHRTDGREAADDLAAVGLPVVDGRHFQAPGYARLPFGGAADVAPELENALARWAALVHA